MRQPILDIARRRGAGHHPGLLLQRYLTQPADPAERRELLDAARQAAKSESLHALYSEAFTRWTRSFPQDEARRSEPLTTASRLIVGLGSANVLETGLRLHHTYGVPIIPGSALKGLAAHYCHDVWGQPEDGAAPEENRRFRREGDFYQLLFGTTEDGGVIAFHDAWIRPDSLKADALLLDVMTPHHPKWQIKEAPPTDFDSPVPVSFLSVAGTFEVRLSWSGPTATPPEQAAAWAALARKLLQEALAERGVGGKTSSGYGRLVPPDSLQSGRQPSAVARATLPRPGDRVDARLLEERTNKGGWKAVHEPSGLVGPIQNSGDVPDDQKPGDTLKLIVASANEKGIAFRYPTPADEERAQRAPSTKAKGRSGSGKGGRRS